MRSPIQSPQCGWFHKTLATCGAQSGCPSSSTPGDLATWTACARAFLTPIHGLGSAVATRLLPQERGPRPRDWFSECPTGSKGDRSRVGPLASCTCATPPASSHSAFPPGRGCQFGWSVGRCSSRWCASARVRPPSSVPNLRRCEARRPRWYGAPTSSRHLPASCKVTGQLRLGLRVEVSLWGEPPAGQPVREEADNGAC